VHIFLYYCSPGRSRDVDPSRRYCFLPLSLSLWPVTPYFNVDGFVVPPIPVISLNPFYTSRRSMVHCTIIVICECTFGRAGFISSPFF